MKEVLFVTGNKVKVSLAQTICNMFGIQVTQRSYDADELQSLDGELIARDKANKAFAHFKQAVVVCDDIWIIPGLGGFPGPYMQPINVWFTIDDWLRLTKDLTDRRIILRQTVVYQDDNVQQAFAYDIEGELLREAKGTSPYPHSSITSFDGGKTSNAEHHEKGGNGADHRRTSWHDFAAWYQDYTKSPN